MSEEGEGGIRVDVFLLIFERIGSIARYGEGIAAEIVVVGRCRAGGCADHSGELADLLQSEIVIVAVVAPPGVIFRFSRLRLRGLERRTRFVFPSYRQPIDIGDIHSDVGVPDPDYGGGGVEYEEEDRADDQKLYAEPQIGAPFSRYLFQKFSFHRFED